MNKSLTFKLCLYLITILFSFSYPQNNLKSQTFSLSKNLINLNSEKGEKLLIESNARVDYLPLSINFVSQDNLAYCGVASMVMVLNALNIPRPEAKEYSGFNLIYHFFTQENVFNENTDKIITAKEVSRRGMTLEQLDKLLETYEIKSDVYYAQDLTLNRFRQILKENLQQKNNFILVNYNRANINQKTGGHISPIAAYNEESDRFLILDVARYKYPPVWVKAEELWNAINTMDSASGKTRGFISVSRK